MGSKRRLRPGDQVVVIAGNNRGTSGKILSCTDKKVLVEGVNVRKKHMKARAENQKSQIIDIECPINISNVALFVNDKAVKLRARDNKKGEKELFYREGDKEVLYRPAKQAKS